MVWTRNHSWPQLKKKICRIRLGAGNVAVFPSAIDDWLNRSASQADLRAGASVLLKVIILGEQLTIVLLLGVLATIAGVTMINVPSKRPECTTSLLKTRGYRQWPSTPRSALRALSVLRQRRTSQVFCQRASAPASYFSQVPP